MKKLAILGCLSFLSATSFGGEPLNLLSIESDEPLAIQSDLNDDDALGPIEVEVDMTYFDKLGAYFKAADVPQVEDIRGWYAGRCFYKHDPNEPLAGLSTLFETERPLGDGKDRGPLFPNVPATKVERKLILWESGTLNEFDQMTDLIRLDIHRMKDNIISSFSELVIHEKSLMSEYSNEARYSVRKMHDYLFSESEVLRNVTLHGHSYQKGEVSGRCYYFKKVAD